MKNKKKKKNNTESQEITRVIREISSLKKQNTELSQAGFELITTQAKLQSLLHNASDGIITFAPDGTVETFNVAAQHIFGYSEGEVVTRKISDLIPCPDWVEDNVGAYINYFISSRASNDIPLIGKHRIGFDILLHVSTGKASVEDTVIFDNDSEEDPFADNIEEDKEDNNVIVCFIRDITLNKKIEKELEDHRYALNLAAGIIMRDKDFRVIDINDHFCNMIGRKRHEFIGEQFIQSKFGGIPDREHKLKQRREFLAQGTPWLGETCFLNSQGEKTWFTESITPFLDENEVPYQYLSILINISEKKQYESQLEQHRDHLQELVDEQISDLKQARDTAEIANKAKSEFLANMSHELRTPMHAIVSFTTLCLKQIKNVPLNNKSTEKLHRFLSNIEVSSKRLLVLLNDLLDLSKLESGNADLNLTKNDLFFLSQQIHTEYSAKAQEKQISIIVEKPATSPIISCDKNKTLQVLSNLIANAIKFSPTGKRVVISFKNEEIVLGKRSNDTGSTPGILFTISDQGVGIPENELSTVFDKFIQSSKTKTGAGGTGLGLAISQEIIFAHNGEIWAEHNPGGGAVFKAFFPYN